MSVRGLHHDHRDIHPDGEERRTSTGWRHVFVVATAFVLVLGVLADPVASQPAGNGRPLIANGHFASPDLSGWDGKGGATFARTREASVKGGHSLEVTSGGGTDSGVEVEAARSTAAGSHELTLAIKGTASSTGKVVRAVVRDPATGERSTSAPVHLAPWWQTTGVVTDTVGSSLRFAVEEFASGEAWRAGDRYLVDDVSANTSGPTPASTSGRELRVAGEPFTIRGYGFSPTPVGGPGYTPSAAAMAGSWQSNPAQCQSDAQLLRTAGVNTLRIAFVEVYTDDGRRCLDALHAAGIKLLWLVNGPQSVQATHVARTDIPGYREAFWFTLENTIRAVRDHPATIGYVIGNENSHGNSGAQAGWFAMLDELAERSKELDPRHVTTTSLSSRQFHPSCDDDGECWEGVGPSKAPNIDLWGYNNYNYRPGWEQRVIDRDPTRPTWISEFGRRRYVCVPHGGSSEIEDVLNLLTCSRSGGSGEDVAFQSAWLAHASREIGANLVTDDPDAAVVGGSVHSYNDNWWFAFCPFTGCGTPLTHEAAPDAFNLPSEWFGTTHALPYEHPGPRVTTESYDQIAVDYTGTDGPVVIDASVTSFDGCQATLTWETDVPTYGRVDHDIDDKVIVGDAIHSENFLARNWIQLTRLETTHTATISGLVPGEQYRAHVRGFDVSGRSGTTAPLVFTPEPPDAGSTC